MQVFVWSDRLPSTHSTSIQDTLFATNVLPIGPHAANVLTNSKVITLDIYRKLNKTQDNFHVLFTLSQF